MPTYVYACSDCSETFEVQQRITEDPLTTCRCGSSGTVKRIIQPIAVMFKGSGFHINDYKSSPSGGATSTPKASESASAESPTTTEHVTPPTAPAPSE